MAWGRLTIAASMKLIGLAALDCVFLEAFGWAMLGSSILLFLVVATNVVLVQAVVFGRPLRAGHHAFLAVGAAYFIAVTVFSYHGPGLHDGTPQILETLIRAYREVTGDFRVFRFNNSPGFWITEKVFANVLGYSLAWGAGLLAARGIRRRVAGPRSDLGSESSR